MSGAEGDSAEAEELRTLEELHSKAQEEVDSLRNLLDKTRSGRIKLQLEAAMLQRIRETTQKCNDKLELTLKKEEGEAAAEAAAHLEELAAYEDRAHVLEVQGTLEEEAQLVSTQELLAAADKYFQQALASTQARSKEFKAMTAKEAEETHEEVELLKKTLDQHLNKIKETFEKSTEELKQQCEREMKLVKKLRAENERMSANNKRLKKEIEMEENIKNARMEVRNLEHQKKTIGRCIGQLQQSLKDVQQETRAGSAAQGALLRLQASETLAKLESNFQKIQSAQSGSNLPQGVPSAICELIQETVIDHNRCEKDLKEELRRCVETYNDMLVFMRHRLDELNVPHASIQAKSIVYQEIVAAANIGDESAAASDTAPPKDKDAKANEQPGEASLGSKGSEDEMVIRGTSTGAPSEHEKAVLKSCSHPSGWAITYPSAKGSDNIYLGQVTLRRLPGN
ncbi:growth-arrest-specific protein 8, putative [Eimeria brunetti]|uniref:Growth-arrest-specific protein 8, putative n=1 Tax=Eimeria brunetti TaxID=51314 RepID=U6LNI8_9EIME|nr:growth-arrest-specific protein 8, putative [Eimeria brunetti]